jgi:hypothetical protein
VDYAGTVFPLTMRLLFLMSLPSFCLTGKTLSVFIVESVILQKVISLDLMFTDDGDIAVSHSGDIAMTPTAWRDDLQQAYIRVMTDQGDHLMYPELGASLSELYGHPQSPETGLMGEALITSAMNREGRFAGKTFSVKSVPTAPQAIRFDISITSGNREQITLSAEQDLGLS